MKLGSNFALSFYSANAESTALRVGVGYQATSNSWHDSRLLNHNFSRLQVQTAVVVVNLEEQPRTNWRGGGYTSRWLLFTDQSAVPVDISM